MRAPAVIRASIGRGVRNLPTIIPAARQTPPRTNNGNMTSRSGSGRGLANGASSSVARPKCFSFRGIGLRTGSDQLPASFKYTPPKTVALWRAASNLHIEKAVSLGLRRSVFHRRIPCVSPACQRLWPTMIMAAKAPCQSARRRRARSQCGLPLGRPTLGRVATMMIDALDRASALVGCSRSSPNKSELGVRCLSATGRSSEKLSMATSTASGPMIFQSVLPSAPTGVSKVRDTGPKHHDRRLWPCFGWSLLPFGDEQIDEPEGKPTVLMRASPDGFR